MGEVVWFRVIDPLSPLYGCDVKLADSSAVAVDRGAEIWWKVIAMRRVDIFVGDRPFQLIAPPGESLGICIDPDQLEPSPLQDETVELQTDRPNGLCLDESEMTRGDGHTLRIARYERATQVALDDGQGTLLGTRTFYGMPDDTGDERVLSMFEQNCDPDEIVAMLHGSN
jgi:hypothetical protein